MVLRGTTRAVGERITMLGGVVSTTAGSGSGILVDTGSASSKLGNVWSTTMGSGSGIGPGIGSGMESDGIILK